MTSKRLEELSLQSSDLISIVIIQLANGDKNGAIVNLHNLKKRIDAASVETEKLLKKTA